MIVAPSDDKSSGELLEVTRQQVGQLRSQVDMYKGQVHILKLDLLDKNRKIQVGGVLLL